MRPRFTRQHSARPCFTPLRTRLPIRSDDDDEGFFPIEQGRTACEYIDSQREPRVIPLGLLDHNGKALVRYVIPITGRIGFDLPIPEGEPDEEVWLCNEDDLRLMQALGGQSGDFVEFEEEEDDDATSG